MRQLVGAVFLIVFLILFLSAAVRAEPATGPGPEAAQPRMGVRLFGFSPSLFKFQIVIPENEGTAGGWQEAHAVLNFVDGRQEPAQRWSCSLRVGIPVRTVRLGRIEPYLAAHITAEIATDASTDVMHRQPIWLTEEYCVALRAEMKLRFANHYGLGARVNQS